MACRGVALWARFIGLALVGPVLAVEPSVAAPYARREWHAPDGLPAEELAAVLFGSDGFLWISTTSAIARFDGSRFWTYPAMAPGNQRAAIARSIVEWPQGSITVAPLSGGLLTWTKGRWQTQPQPAGRSYTRLFTTTDGALWAGSADGLVSRFTREGLQTFDTASDTHISATITFAESNDHVVWVASGTNLYRYGGERLEPVGMGPAPQELRICSSRSGGPWIAGERALFRFQGRGLVEVATLPRLVSAHFIQAMHESAAGALWIATRSQGVFVHSHDTLQPVDVSNESVLALAEDDAGSIWAATNGGGLNRFRRTSTRLYNRSSGLLDNGSNTVCEDVAGNIWLANRDGGVVRLSPDGTLTSAMVPPDWPVISAAAVAPDPRGGIWVTAGPGLLRIRDATRPVLEKPDQPRLPIIRCLLAAKDGSLWFAHETGLVGSYSGGKVRLYGKEEGFVGGNVRFITEDVHGRIWIGTDKGVLLRRDAGQFESVPVEAPPGPINAIRVDPDDTIWLGTGNAGLVVRQAGKWRTIDHGAGMPTDTITQIIADDRGDEWFGSPEGIFRINHDELRRFLDGAALRVHASMLGKDESIGRIVCTPLFEPAVWKTHDGVLWFTTRRGALRIDPASLPVVQAVPKIRIEDVICDDAPAVPRTHLAVPVGFKKLEFRLSVLCLALPELVRVRYRLDGFDDDWLPTPPSHNLVFPRLPAGTYTLRVAADLAGQAGAETTDELTFTVPTRWWQTLWFRGGVLLLCALVIAWAVRAVSHRRLQARIRQIERESALERERTRIAQNIHDDLGAGLTHISLLTQSDEPDGAPGQLERIYHVVSGLTRSMDEIVWAVNPKYDDLEGLVYYLGNYVQDFLADANIRCRLAMPAQVPALPLPSQLRHHLFLCCKEALNNVVKHSGASVVAFALTVSQEELVLSIADNGRGLAGDSGAKRPASGQGTTNMQHRMAQLGGSCTIRDGAEGGTEVRLSVPLHFPHR